jgi:hypothetical protein
MFLEEIWTALTTIRKGALVRKKIEIRSQGSGIRDQESGIESRSPEYSSSSSRIYELTDP